MHKSKISNEELIKAYSELHSIWKIAKLYNMCGQSVHERLKKLGINNSINILSEKEKQQIRDLYINGFKSGDGKLDDLCKEINRTKQFISRYAKSINLTNRHRKNSDTIKKQRSITSKEYLIKHGHPKGMLGKNHSIKTRKRFSIIRTEEYKNMPEIEKKRRSFKAIKTKIDKYGSCFNTNGDTKKTWKAGWREIDTRYYYFRSRWEANYARYLQSLKENKLIFDWLYEPDVLYFENEHKSYIPDFKIICKNNNIQYHEVKGWYDERSKCIFSLMKKYYPNVTLLIINGKWFNNNKRVLNSIPNWE